MILDKGICTVYRRTEIAEPGRMPRGSYAVMTQSWYGELSYETSPSRPTEGRDEQHTDARIRILQCTKLKKNDLVILRDLQDFEARDSADLVYKITRAYHGRDDQSGELITDLTLEVDTP